MSDFDMDIQIKTQSMHDDSDADSQTLTRTVLSIGLSCFLCDLTSRCPSHNTRCTTIDTLC